MAPMNSIGTVDEQTRLAGGDGSGQADRGAVADRGTPVCWAASMTARPQPSLRDGIRCTSAAAREFVFAAFVDVAVERDVVVDTELSGIRPEPVVPPTAADHVQVHVVAGVPQIVDHVEGVFDRLCGDQPRQHAQPRRRRGVGRRGGGASRSAGTGSMPFVDHGDPFGVHAQFGQFRADGRDTVT